jgi:hypothetical protein
VATPDGPGVRVVLWNDTQWGFFHRAIDLRHSVNDIAAQYFGTRNILLSDPDTVERGIRELAAELGVDRRGSIDEVRARLAGQHVLDGYSAGRLCG